MTSRIFKETEKKPDPVDELDFTLILPGDMVRYQTQDTGHRCGTVVGRETKKKANKYHANNTAPIIVTVGVGNRKKVVVTRTQLMEWRPAGATKAA